ncbi:histidine phosphatase family protein [Alkaliphilus metalliredigens]|uniref:histidine phosphatase family protein n=1 Tax=Alkaliphilus metalliredigens TaxID=208226 RepID=UPI001F61BA0A|nr:histidine phosphatase family protein [Alkaliphilus metalliredigens]
MNLYIVRHGETEWNTQRRMQGWQDSNLTERGIEDARALHDHLIKVEFDSIYASPSSRAFKTAELIKGERKLKIIKDDNIREIGLGNWEGKTTEEIEQMDPKAYQHFWKAPHLYNRESVETFTCVQKRALKTINKLIEEESAGNILIVTHAVTVKTIMGHFQKQSLEKLWEPPFIQNTSVSLIRIENNLPSIVLYGDTSHLQEAYETY